VSHKIIILQHTPLVTPGYFTELMNEDLVETTIIRLDKGEKIPVNLDIYDGMICLGGPMDTWMEEQYPWMIDEKNKIKEFVLNNQKPYLGICLGCQFLGEILGGKVIKSNPPEIGVLNINILDNKKKDQIFQNFDNQIKALQWHSYEVSELNNSGDVVSQCTVTISEPNSNALLVNNSLLFSIKCVSTTYSVLVLMYSIIATGSEILSVKLPSVISICN